MVPESQVPPPTLAFATGLPLRTMSKDATPHSVGFSPFGPMSWARGNAGSRREDLDLRGGLGGRSSRDGRPSNQEGSGSGEHRHRAESELSKRLHQNLVSCVKIMHFLLLALA